MNMRKISIKEFKKRRCESSYISVYIVIRSISVENEQEIEVVVQVKPIQITLQK